MCGILLSKDNVPIYSDGGLNRKSDLSSEIYIFIVNLKNIDK